MINHHKYLLAVCALLVYCAGMYSQSFSSSSVISSQDVSSIAQDKEGYIWMGTNNGLNRFNGSSYTRFNASDVPGDIDSYVIYTLCVSSDGTLWAGTENGIAYWRNGRFYHGEESLYSPVTKIVDSRRNSIFAVGMNGIVEFTYAPQYIRSYAAEDTNSVTDMFPMDNGDLWISSENQGGTSLVVLDSTFTVRSTFKLPQGSSVKSISEPFPGEIWVFGNAIGLKVFDSSTCEEKKGRGLDFPQIDPTEVLFMRPYLGDMHILGVKDSGVYIYNPRMGTLTQIFHEERLHAEDVVSFVDQNGGLWLTDSQNGIRYYPYSSDYNVILLSETGERVGYMDFDFSGNLWVHHGNRILCVDPDSGEIRFSKQFGSVTDMLLSPDKSQLYAITDERSVSVFSVGDSSITIREKHDADFNLNTIGISASGDIFITAPTGIYRLSENGFERMTLPHPASINGLLPIHGNENPVLLTADAGTMEILSDNSFSLFNRDLQNLSCGVKSSDGTFWFGTFNKGIARFNPITGGVRYFGAQWGAPISSVRSIIEDDYGNIWFSNPSEIMMFDLSTTSFSTISYRNGNGNLFNRNSVAKSMDGRLYFGGSGYIIIVDPKYGAKSPQNNPFVIESVQYGGKTFLGQPTSLKLGHKENTLSVSFASINYELGDFLHYSYRMTGLDDNWTDIQGSGYASYSYLPAGRYVFEARVRDINGNWSSKQIRLPIVIKSSPWASLPAKLVYALLLGALLYGVFYTILRFRMQKERIAISEAREKMKQDEVDFVTNISHEFRTPLSMIYAPAKELQKHKLKPDEMNLVNLIDRNAERLKSLSEEILGGNRLSSNELTLVHGDLAVMTRTLSDSLRFAAYDKNLSLSFKMPDHLECVFDEEKIGKIFLNLLSNAIKYTPEGGKITIGLGQDDSGEVTLAVTDTGIGVPEEDRERIFQRYERLSKQEGPQVEGHGIGLHFASELSKVHKGSLTCSSNDPVGSVFTFVFPGDKASYGDAPVSEKIFTEDSFPEVQDDDLSRSKSGVVLIAEDNNDVRSFLKLLFMEDYNVVLASDGSEALDNIRLSPPDIILSDLVMPNMTGLELCRILKNDPDFKHLPIVLLTAKADVESSISGFNYGADAYVKKPFDPEYIKAVVRSLLQNRKLIQEKVSNLTSDSPEMSEASTDGEYLGLTRLEREFIGKLHSVIDTNLENPDLNVSYLADEMGMSYSNLQLKIKTLTGKSPLAFLNSYRMNIAERLLKDGYTPSEVSFRVGFSSPSSFSRDFKKHFGISPSKVEKIRK